MKLKYNRFALVPTLCTECKRYILFEPYRKGERFHMLIGHYIPVKACSDCIAKFDIGRKGCVKND